LSDCIFAAKLELIDEQFFVLTVKGRAHRLDCRGEELAIRGPEPCAEAKRSKLCNSKKLPG
jgi:hypothetical protein